MRKAGEYTKRNGPCCPRCEAVGAECNDSRIAPLGQRRRRKCIVCGYLFTTIEMVATYSPDGNMVLPLVATEATIREFETYLQAMRALVDQGAVMLKHMQNERK